VNLDDIALANALAHEVLGRSLDELPPQNPTLARAHRSVVASNAQRSRSAVRSTVLVAAGLREAIGWG